MVTHALFLCSALSFLLLFPLSPLLFPRLTTTSSLRQSRPQTAVHTAKAAIAAAASSGSNAASYTSTKPAMGCQKRYCYWGRGEKGGKRKEKEEEEENGGRELTSSISSSSKGMRSGRRRTLLRPDGCYRLCSSSFFFDRLLLPFHIPSFLPLRLSPLDWRGEGEPKKPLLLSPFSLSLPLLAKCAYFQREEEER